MAGGGRPYGLIQFVISITLDKELFEFFKDFEGIIKNKADWTREAMRLYQPIWCKNYIKKQELAKKYINED